MFAVIFSILLIGTVYAEDSNNDGNLTDEGNFNEIQKLINDAKSGDSIYLENKNYRGNGSIITINKDIKIHGSASSPTILDADGKSNIFVISKNVEVSITGLTFTNSNSPSGHGAIDNSGILTIHDSKFIKNKGYNQGAAISSFGKSELTVYDSLFESNNAFIGTTLDSYNSNTVIVNCTFKNNHGHEGGAIYVRLGNFDLINSTFINNSAVRGGGIYNNRGYLRVFNSEFYSNTAQNLGGGLKSWGYCEIYDSIFKDNQGEIGGGIYISEYMMTVQNCLLENNIAEDGGGLVVHSDGHLNIKNSVFNNNFAEMGGGLSLSQGYMNLTNCSFNNNTAGDNGGGIALQRFEANMDKVILNSNHARIGGGLYIGDVKANFTDFKFNNNSASEGGAIYNIGTVTLNNFSIDLNNANRGGAIYNKATLNLYNVNANNNKATSYGGFAYNEATLNANNLNANKNNAELGGVIYNNKYALVNNSIFTNNNANNGAVISSSSDLIIDNSNFEKNTVGHSWGIIHLSKGNANISNSIFKYNEGSDEGGVIFNNADVLVNNSQFISNKALSYGGAIDNSGTLAVLNSLFDQNQAYGAGAIDNGGSLTVKNSKFTNNQVTKNGGAIDNKGDMNVTGSIFENNIAGGDGGAVIARSATNISYSIICDNHDSKGYAIFNNTYDQISLSDNWWGLNDPDFDKLLNFNTSDNFTWIIMEVSIPTTLTQHRTADLLVSLENVRDKNNHISKLDSPELLPVFDLKLSLTDEIISVSNGRYSNSFSLPTSEPVTVKINDDVISLDVVSNPYKITENKNVVVDYDGKATFKVRIVDSFNVPAKGVDVVMTVSGKTYHVKTDDKGYASNSFTLTPGKYTVNVKCDDDAATNTLEIKSVLFVKNAVKKKAKKIKFSAKLKTSNGKSIVGKQIKFKVKGKNYSAKTNKKGVATVKFKNLKVGKYKVNVIYLNYNVKKTLKVKK